MIFCKPILSCAVLLMGMATQLPVKAQQAFAHKIVVDINGSGDYRSVQAAINSLPDSSVSPALIYIRKGVYKEKLLIQKHHFVIEGEDSFDGFKLGRYHRDAQFYLINCSFAANMANEDIYLVITNNKIQWGRRIYYFNCHRQGVDFAWYADNLETAEGHPAAGAINPDWVFGNRWKPVE